MFQIWSVDLLHDVLDGLDVSQLEVLDQVLEVVRLQPILYFVEQDLLIFLDHKLIFSRFKHAKSIFLVQI